MSEMNCLCSHCGSKEHWGWQHDNVAKLRASNAALKAENEALKSEVAGLSSDIKEAYEDRQEAVNDRDAALLKWYKFDASRGSRQKRPPEHKPVLVYLVRPDGGEAIVVGYRKNAAGDKQSPYFVRPGAGEGVVKAWCDCLPDVGVFDLWEGARRSLRSPLKS